MRNNTGQMATPITAEQLWQFSLAFYPKVKPICLHWQDTLGANINLLLLLCFLEQQQLCLSPQHIQQLSAALENFSAQFTRPLRQLRRSASQNLLTPAQQQQLKHSLLTAELELERLEQQLLLAQCPALTADAQPLLESYLALLTLDTTACAGALLDLRQSLLQSG